MKSKLKLSFSEMIKNSDYFNINFSLQRNPLEIVESYCYLGIIQHETGELRTAQVNLKMKAMRAFFGLMRTIIRSKLSFKSLLILLDSLIKPITLYWAPIWAPTSTINKSIIKQLNTSNTQNFIPKVSRAYSEKVHIPYLKWALSHVHKKHLILLLGSGGKPADTL